MIFPAAFGVRRIEIGLASMLGLVSGATIVIYGVAQLADTRFPRWLGLLGLAGGVLTFVGGIALAYSRFSATAMIVNMPAGILTMSWMLALGIHVWIRPVFLLALPGQAPPSGSAWAPTIGGLATEIGRRRAAVASGRSEIPVVGREGAVDFIMMLTRNDRTVADADELVDPVIGWGVKHIGFKDIGVPTAVMRSVVRKVRAARAISYLEVVSTAPEAVTRSLEAGRDLGVDRILGGTDIAAAKGILNDLTGYYPFPGLPVGHPTRLGGSPALVADHCRAARAAGCGGVDLLAYRATDADPLDLVRAAHGALSGGRLIVAGSVNSRERIHALAAAGADAFTIGSAAFDGSFSPSKGALRSQIRDILEACETAPKIIA
ncbi:MAG: hypothetical protein EXQ95_14185 [Alphaproteobacteria bacterium]|nr:hypothetical protein [Alphaproteobacteria bacterium]